MFTGIVEELGEVTGRVDLTDAARLSVRGHLVSADARLGDSIAVNGVCLTVTSVADGIFDVDVMGETLRRSSLATAAPGTRVNLERALRMGDRLGGHVVQGHVDGVGQLAERARPHGAQDWELVRVAAPPEVLRYVVGKGSITVDGVSLTVVDVDDTSFSIGLIPTTAEVTTLGFRGVGDPVNLEVDVLAKYVERLLGPHVPGADPAVTR